MGIDTVYHTGLGIITGLPAECFHPDFKNGQDGASGKASLPDCPSQAAGGEKSLSLQLCSGRLDGLCLPQPGTEEPSQAAVRVCSTDGTGWLPAFCSRGFVLVPVSNIP